LIISAQGHEVKGYAIMPNHLDVLIDFGTSEKNINQLLAMLKDL
jgi:hypothetical protein